MYQQKTIQSEFVKFFWYVLALLVGVFLCRLLAMYIIPLNDSTEARYGEIARKMLELNNWVTPMHDYGVPFWGKPPLSTWLAASSMKLFGVNELAARLPSLILALGVLGLVWQVVKNHSGELVGLYAISILATSACFIICAGTVMTDPTLLFCLTLTMVSFWFAVTIKVQKNEPLSKLAGTVEFRKRFWGYLFFIGLALGLLAKGPIALIFTGFPIFCWVCLRRQWRAMWQNLPWIRGTLLMLLIALPWYLLAEHRTPGFLNYFIVGEHFHRFLTSAWQGDKYGFAHATHLGMIWVFAFLAIFPWPAPFVWCLAKQGKKLPGLCRDDDGWVSYWLLAMLTPLVFFTFAKNTIYPYALPCLPGFAIFFAEMVQRSGYLTIKKQIFGAAVLAMVGLLGAIALFLFKPEWVAKSYKPIIKVWQQQAPSPASQLFFFQDTPTFSAQFYAAGHVKMLNNWDELGKPQANYLLVNTKYIDQLSPTILESLTKIRHFKILKNDYQLYRKDKLDTVS